MTISQSLIILPHIRTPSCAPLLIQLIQRLPFRMPPKYITVPEKIEDRLKAARQLAKNNPLAAVKAYYQVLFLNKNHLLSYKELADVFTKIGDLSPAIACLQYSLAVKHDIIVEDELHSLLILRGTSLLEQGDVLNFLEGTEHEQFGNYIDFKNESLARANAFILTCHLHYAYAEVQKVLQIDSSNMEALLLRGKLHFAFGRFAEGNQDYWTVHGMQPDNKEVQEFILFVMPKVNNLIAESKLQLVQRDNERCLLNVKRGLDMCPHSQELLLMKAYQHRISHDYQSALKCLDTALKQDPKNVDIKKQIAITYNEMAMFLFERKNYEDALTLFHEALKYKSEDWGILVNRGDTYKSMGKLNECIQDYRAAYNLDPNETVAQRLAIVLHSFGVEFFNKRLFQQACDSFTQALQLSESTDILYKRGKCLQQLQKYHQALQDFEQVLRLDPSHYEAQIQVRALGGKI